jgi:hypothetical protein
MGVAVRWRSTVATGSLLVSFVLLAGCARDGLAADSPSPSAVASRASACSPAPVVVPSEERTTGWLSGEQEPLRSDLDVVLEYGAERPDEFTGAKVANEPWVRIVAAFTDNLDEHCAALHDVVAHPERLEVVRRPYSLDELQRIRDEIQPMMTSEGLIEGLGISWDHVSVELRADGEALAAELWARYGAALRLQVARAPYPPSDSPTAGVPCDIGEIDAWPPGVSASLELEDDVVVSGAHGRGTVTIINESAERFRADLGEPEIGWIFEQGATTPVGVFTGAIAGEGRTANLAPGEQIALRMVFGTAACDPSQGYALPPGTYDVRSVVSEETPGDEGSTWLSDPARLRVVEAADS